MTDQQDAVERVLDKYVYEVVGREGHGTEWHCHECVQWSNRSRASVDHNEDCPVGLLEAQRSRLETCQQENERLLRAVEEVIKHDGEFDPRGGYFHDAEVPQHKMDELINAYHEVQEARNA